MRKMKKVLAVALATVMAFGVSPMVDKQTADAETLSSVKITGVNFSAAGSESLSGNFDVTYTFHNVSTGTQNWENYCVELRDTTNNCIDVRADKYGWTWAGATETQTAFPDSVKTGETWQSGYEWKNFVSTMKTGVDVTINVVRAGNVFTFITDNTFCKFKYTVPFEMTNSITISLGGENVNLTNITFTDNNAAGKYNMEDYRSGSTYTAPTKEGKVFAGWYADAEFTTPIGKDVKTGYAYAKFADEKLLTAKCQTRAGTTVQSDSADIRMMLGVDSLNYSNVGFDVTFKGTNYNGESETVYRKISVTDNETTVNYSPAEVFKTNDAVYMLSCILTDVVNADFGENIEITPYWTTLDGTKVTGTTKITSINAAFELS